MLTRAQLVAVACLSGLLALASGASAQTRVTYLANEGVIIEHGTAKVLVDPLFDNGFGQYRLLPPAMQTALYAGDAPFDDVDAVLVSHAHGDHFSAELMLRYLRARGEVSLYAPVQAVTALRQSARPDDAGLFDRVTGLALEVGDDGIGFQLEGLSIDAVRVPHSGWPTRMTDIENLVFRVRLADSSTVLHFGDAAASPEHFAGQAVFWDRQANHLALPPYWFFLSDAGREILREQVGARQSVGIHVPTDVPAEAKARPPELRSYDLFTEPGDWREIATP